eukprot:1192918-Prorocentrum_lima.AAC.1
MPEAIQRLDEQEEEQKQASNKTKSEARVFAETAAKVQQKLKARDRLAKEVLHLQRLAAQKENDL